MSTRTLTDRSTQEAPLTYRAYIASRQWKERKRKLLEKRGHYCQDCGSFTRNPQVHHLNYERLGVERESDLLILCRRCHKDEHGIA